MFQYKGNTLIATPGFDLNVTIDMFFRDDDVLAKLDAKAHKVLSSTGALAQTIMRRGMRRRKKASTAGGFPSAHGNALLKEMILFGHKGTNPPSLVVGPRLLDSTDKAVAASGKTVPQLINEGGTVMRRAVYDPKKNKIHPIRKSQAPIPWHYKPRPFVRLTRDATIAAFKRNMRDIPLK